MGALGRCTEGGIGEGALVLERFCSARETVNR